MLRHPRVAFALALMKESKIALYFFLLCFLLGEIENAQYEGCGFGWGFDCSLSQGPRQCEHRKNEHEFCWTWIDELYFAVITFTTIGYGDVSAHTKGGKVLATVLCAMGIFSFTTVLGAAHNITMAKKMGAEKTMRERLEELNEVIAADDDGVVSPEEYIIHNLKKMDKVDDETIQLLRDQFEALDADGSGELDADDVELLTTECARQEAEAAQAAKEAPKGAAKGARASRR